MKLSIIIPVYNAKNYIDKCLASVFAIKIDNLEVICIDDGSDDGTNEILNEYARHHSDLKVMQQMHSGASAARNYGISVSTGDYIFFLDSDDYIAFPNNLISILEASAIQQVDLCIFNALINGQRLYQDTLPVITQSVSGPEMMKLLYEHCRTIPTPVWMQLYKRQFLIDNIFLQKEDTYHEDELFTPIVLYYTDRSLCFNIPVVDYQLNRPGAITTQFGEKYYIDWVNIGRDLYDFFIDVKAEEDEPFRQVFGVFAQLMDLLISKSIPYRRFLCHNDFTIMHNCARTLYEKRCAKLALVSSHLYTLYRKETMPKFVRKIINLLIR